MNYLLNLPENLILIGLELILEFQKLPAERRIKGTTPIGRATCQRLDLNDDRYPVADSIQATRQLWVKVGWHPPADDPCIF